MEHQHRFGPTRRGPYTIQISMVWRWMCTGMGVSPAFFFFKQKKRQLLALNKLFKLTTAWNISTGLVQLWESSTQYKSLWFDDGFVQVWCESCFFVNKRNANFGLRTSCLSLPLHVSSAQGWSSEGSPTQSKPPLLGAGSVQVRVRLLLPPPHVTEQVLHSVHWDHPPSTGVK